ncbi:hypothetical protein CMI37_03355 [Candidatus Pacearchaeota archaeon]|nr:hypothetical protein [Candidatus Pacearchaeota archaeon]|tara:strand:+ start:3366 stop:3806 length:441 start_codon:yes stop_codon:yes gene_type:complete
MSLTFYFNSKEQPQRPDDDQLPEELTVEEFQEQYAKIVYCDYEACFWNTYVKGLHTTKGTILGNKNYVAFGAQGFANVCARPAIAITGNTYTIGNQKRVLPTCFTTAKNGKTGHVDFSKLLQSDGTPFGGSIESQAPTLDNYEAYI